jgi:hypothetical protein
MGIRNGEDNWLETGQRDEDGDEESDWDNDEFDLAEQATIHPPCYSGAAPSRGHFEAAAR